ncbi:toll/interleukin-1 receptor domain-containing protein [Myceligenerans xiligouense]|uniref:TIR domain-containing protein n=1 Tax=Myceligenerans xiligouense TaxID=253184 RepID=A0A3N4YMH4_9MICO|nr:toll/interleukin-1 receptor domain-containing protein [Myceligenerans xiligouense]RPF21317.1 TIR domain-containing protein [Myceligenerans xiligouense]
MDASGTKYFISHATSDKDAVRPVALQVQVLGGEVFFDEWSIGYGESVPGAISTALDNYEVLALFWSRSASKSAWVQREYLTAINGWISDDRSRRLIVLRLDDTDVPPLLKDLKWFDLRAGDEDGAVCAIMQIDDDAERLRGLQRWIETLGDLAYNPGYGVAIACPQCGAKASALENWSQVDHERDDTYAGLRCTECDWVDGGEIIG